MNAILECSSLYQAFGGGRSLLGPPRPKIQAVSDVNLQIQRGQTLGIVGESGCGKSTLARMLVGLDQPTSGDIYIHGKDLHEEKRNNPRRLRQQIQFVFQDPLSSLNPRKTIRQILEAPLRHLLNKTPSQRQTRLQELMQVVNLRPEFLDRYPHEFSGGQSQRIGIARALAAEPEVMVLDLKMPGIDGMEVLRRVKRTHPRTEVIILTGHGSDAEEVLAGELGAFAYLRKPVDIEVLTKTMKAAYHRLEEARAGRDGD